MEATPVPALRDNYVWLLHGTQPERVAVVDPGEAEPVRAVLRDRSLTPSCILVTHRHWDHVNGIGDLLQEWDLPVYGPADEPVPERSRGLSDGDRLELEELGLSFDISGVPGHTLGHIAYHGHGVLLSGDTLFSAGCGRVFEGTPAQMRESLHRLRDLPGETRVLCGHEYTLKNLEFCAAVEPDNADIRAHQEWAREQRNAGAPTLPSTLEQERRTNVFLRCDQASVRAGAEDHAERPLEDADAVFATIREWKDRF